MGKVTALLRTAARVGPVAYPAVRKLAATLRDNPELARYGQDLAGKFARSRANRSRPEGLRHAVGVLRTTAEQTLARATSADDVARAERWLSEATKLDAAIDLMELHDRKRRGREAEVIEARVEELFAEIFTVMVTDREDDGPPALT